MRTLSIKPALFGVLATCFSIAIVFATPPRRVAHDYTVGMQLFLSRCLACHDVNSSSSSKLGPSFYGLADRAKTRESGVDAPDYVVRSLFQPAAYVVPGYPAVMPKGLMDDIDDDGVRSLVGYILTADGSASPDGLDGLEIPPRKKLEPITTTRSELELGNSVFFGKGKCSACHSTHSGEQDASIAPKIFHVGLSAEQIRNGFESKPRVQKGLVRVYLSGTAPNQPGMTPAGSSTASSGDDGEEPLAYVDGKLLDRDEASLTLLVLGETQLEERIIPLNQVALGDDGGPKIENLAASLKPDDFATVLTPAERDALVKVIAALN